MRVRTITAAGFFVFSTVAHAQCADGTQMCGMVRSSAAPVRVAMPIDDQAWLVVPFDNPRRDSTATWLRDASVTLLSSELSRWTDIRVIDEKRVAAFLRDVPSASGSAIALEDALAVARRAGAGRLVMGSVLRLGARTTISGAVYSTRTGARVRAVQAIALTDDSLPAAYARLSRGALDMTRGAPGQPGAFGTTNIAAVQDYVRGVGALNRFAIGDARRFLERALKTDSTFALAHYKLALAMRYDEQASIERQLRTPPMTVTPPADGSPPPVRVAPADTARLFHLTAAARFAASLPPRERALASGLLAMQRREFAKASAAYAELVRADSSDVEALYGLGDALYRDDVVEAAGSDTTQLRFRGSWNASLKLLRRALAIDPTLHLAFAPIYAILMANTRRGCRAENTIVCTPAENVRPIFASVRRDGDSILVTPQPGASANLVQSMGTTFDPAATRRRNLEEARNAAQDWVDAGPREAPARRSLGIVLLAIGLADSAEKELALAATAIGFDEVSISAFRAEAAVKAGRGGDAIRFLDSLMRAFPSQGYQISIGMFNVITGRFSGYETARLPIATSGMLRGAGPPPPAGSPADSARRIALNTSAEYSFTGMRAVVGVDGDRVIRAERNMMSLAARAGLCPASCLQVTGSTLAFGLALPRAAWPTFVTGTGMDPRVAPAIAVARRDTAALRIAADSLYSLLRSRIEMFAPDDGSGVIAADAYLILGDTLRALEAVRRTLDGAMPITSATVTSVIGSTLFRVAATWPRTMLLRADLAAATGQAAEAREWYRRFVDLWALADAEYQPIVTRARAALAALPQH